jgi:hypothetical protein
VTEIKITCDRCKVLVTEVPTGLVELRSGASRRRRPVDLCRSCEKEFKLWLGPDSGEEGEAQWEGEVR